MVLCPAILEAGSVFFCFPVLSLLSVSFFYLKFNVFICKTRPLDEATSGLLDRKSVV